ncbi:MAG: hypothetical protein Q7J80_00185, partial [Anaerolineales bacterium]|nr:hypothetical protein [Anaerolineales bacterium]
MIAFIITPAVVKLLDKLKARKQIKSAADAPIFHSLHKGKEGTPTMGGVIIWLTVLGLAAILFIFHLMFDG